MQNLLQFVADQRKASPIMKIVNPTLVVGVATLAGLLATGSAQATSYPITAQQRAQAQQVAQQGVPLSALAPDAPDQVTVVPGDTLWGISGRFLKQPWRWPELWGMNLEQIRNPHLIYPGQVLVLERDGDRARLRLAQGATGTVKLGPAVRSEAVNAAISSIPAQVIEPFLTQPLVVEVDTLNSAPRIFRAQEGRVFLGPRDLAYARGVKEPAGTVFHVFRPATPLFDPTGDPKVPIAHEARFLGTAVVEVPGDPATLRVLAAKEEIGVNDRLMPAPPPNIQSYIPRPAPADMAAVVMSIPGGSPVSQAGPTQVISINRGKSAGVEVGHVLEILRRGEQVTDRTGAAPEQVQLPNERYGQVFVFRTFDKVSYGLIMQADRPVQVGDLLRAPTARP